LSGEKVGVAAAAADDTDAHNDDDAVDHTAAQRQPVVSVVPDCFQQGRN